MAETFKSPVVEGTLVGGRYRLSTPLGEGGMGWVFRATDSTLDDQEVALKFLYPHLLSDTVSFSRFQNEVLVARKLIHQNIVRTFNMGVDVGQAFIVMEYIRGQTLKGLLHAEGIRGISCDRAILIAVDICRGVCHSHSLGIIHRDLKPENVLLTIDGQAKLSDFGLAATLRRQGTFTRVGQLLGTPYYMAPEQFRGEPPDERSDIYAFGILLYELLYGHVPFDDSSLYGLAMKHSLEPIQPPQGAEQRISPALWELVQRAAHKQPASRFASSEELLASLEKIAGIDPDRPTERATPAIALVSDVEHKPELPPYDIWRFTRRATLPVIFLTLVIGIPWVRVNSSAQARVAYFFILLGKHTGIAPDPFLRVFGMDPEFLRRPLVDLSQNQAWSRIHAGENPDAPENRDPNNRNTALHVATANADLRLVTLLLRHGASPEITNRIGLTPLHTAVIGKDPKIVELLLAQDIALNPQTADLVTPLHLAVQQGDLAITMLLVSRGANPLLKDRFGWSPAMYSVSAGHTELIEATLGRLSTAQIPMDDLRAATPTQNIEAVRNHFIERYGSAPF